MVPLPVERCRIFFIAGVSGIDHPARHSRAHAQATRRIAARGLGDRRNDACWVHDARRNTRRCLSEMRRPDDARRHQAIGARVRSANLQMRRMPPHREAHGGDEFQEMAFQRVAAAGLGPVRRTRRSAGIGVEGEMELSAHVRKVSRFEDLLLRVTDTDQRQQISKMLTEEEARAVPKRLGSRPGD